MKNDGISVRDIANKFNLSRSSISLVINGKSKVGRKPVSRSKQIRSWKENTTSKHPESESDVTTKTSPLSS